MNYNPYFTLNAKVYLCWLRVLLSFFFFNLLMLLPVCVAVVIVVIDAFCIMKNEIYAESQKINQTNSRIHSRPPRFIYTFQAIINALLNDLGPFSCFHLPHLGCVCRSTCCGSGHSFLNDDDDDGRISFTEVLRERDSPIPFSKSRLEFFSDE